MWSSGDSRGARPWLHDRAPILRRVSERLVVIGADPGGMAALSQVRKLRDDMEIVAFERGRYTSYSACGIPYLVGGEVESLDKLIARTRRVSVIGYGSTSALDTR